ncbi:helix-hairpin-helix domain-containing protein, partial [Candidatus Vampirococcus lugosii]
MFSISEIGEEELKNINGIGDITAKNIINYIEENEICEYNELLQINRVGQKILEEIKNITYLDTSCEKEKDKNEDKEDGQYGQDENEEDEQNGQDIDELEEEENEEDEQNGQDIDELEEEENEEDEQNGQDIEDLEEEENKINLLQIGEEELKNINGIGDITAKNIINYIEENEICEYNELLQINR